MKLWIHGKTDSVFFHITQTHKPCTGHVLLFVSLHAKVDCLMSSKLEFEPILQISITIVIFNAR